MNDFSSLRQQAADLFGIPLTPEQAALFEVYARELVAWNTHTNLTAITAPDAVRVRHFLDSLSAVKGDLPPDGRRIIDIGSGAGFPGLPLAIAFPGVRVTLMEATGKKVAFLNHVIQVLGLANAAALHARAEEAGQNFEHRAQYDLVLARAVARLPGLVEYMLPLARVGGRCTAMKGVTAEEEAHDAKRALRLLGGRLNRIEPVSLPGLDEPRYLVLIDKVAATPAQYPRKSGIPTRRPLT